MIKRSYDRHGKNYFANFVTQLDNQCVRDALKPYNATVAKSKSNWRYNIKFHDPKLYTVFVLRYSK